MKLSLHTRKAFLYMNVNKRCRDKGSNIETEVQMWRWVTGFGPIVAKGQPANSSDRAAAAP